ncbi:MAG TPA: molybdopterin-dependent oxidoreductase, partial [Casimicrobiaceae bacterium]|nr:molybdopterin-dependent oxidoreductase [Casimicrobiaceae bacterium]
MIRDAVPPRRRFMRHVLGSAGALILAGCDRLSSTEWFPKLLGQAEYLSQGAAKVFARKTMAKEYTAADLSPQFRSNGTAEPNNAEYRALAMNGFADYRLVIDGLVEQPARLALTDLKALPSRTQITRHDCVEGWSAIGKWQGARLSAVLNMVRPKPNARYVVFHCADPMEDDGTEP